MNGAVRTSSLADRLPRGAALVVFLVLACSSAGMAFAGVLHVAHRVLPRGSGARHVGGSSYTARRAGVGAVSGLGSSSDANDPNRMRPTVTTRDGLEMPRMLYGTAWKGQRTAELVETALRAGFRGVDTACQPKHYREEGVGDAVVKIMSDPDISPPITRDALFLQTKYTPFRGQDPNNVPYDPAASIPEQVAESFARSRANLQTDYVDSLLLHSPFESHSDTMLAWRTMEGLHDTGQVRQLGISNQYDVQGFKRLYAEARVKPGVLQNRFYADSGYDVELRAFCAEHGVVYQSFWTLTANRDVLFAEDKGGGVKPGAPDEAGRRAVRAAVEGAAKTHRKTPAQVWFRWLVQGLGVVPLTGTTDPIHMVEDLDVFMSGRDFALTDREMEAIHAAVLGAKQ